MKYLAILATAVFLALAAVTMFPTKMTPYRHAIMEQYNVPDMVLSPIMTDEVTTFYYETQAIRIINQGDEINPLIVPVKYD